jgi:hypothetical protein
VSEVWKLVLRRSHQQTAAAQAGAPGVPATTVWL